MHSAKYRFFRSLLKDIEDRKVDKIICLGDIIAKGTHQKECLDLIKEMYLFFHQSGIAVYPF